MRYTQKIIVICILAALAVADIFVPMPLTAKETRHATDPVIATVELEIAGRREITDPLKNTAKKLIGFLEGETLSGEKLQSAIDVLKSSGLFKAITVPDPDLNKPVTTLTFQLTPFTRIKDIKIKGGFPVLERDILNAMTVYTGDVYSPEKIERQKERIEKIFTDEGYTDPKVRIVQEQDPADMNHVLTISIDKGDYYAIREFQFSGNKNISSGRLHLRFDAWKTLFPGADFKRFVRKKIDTQIKGLEGLYRSKGYYDVALNPDIQINPKTNEVTIHLAIDEGPLYEIMFEENYYFWDFQLRKNLTLEEYGNLNGIPLKRSLRHIKTRYQKAGFPDAEIIIKEEADNRKKESRTIHIVIDEGLRSVVRSLSIQGNRALDTDQINKQILTRTSGLWRSGKFVRDIFEADKSSIEALYLKEGYRNIRVTDTVKWQDDTEKGLRYGDIIISVEEGDQTLVDEIILSGFNVVNKKAIQKMLMLKAGEPFSIETLKDDEAGIAALISEKGYPHVTVASDFKTTVDGKNTTVTYRADEGPFFSTGIVFCTGNFRTKEQVILNEVENKPGQPFSLVKMLKTQQNIRNINALYSAGFKLSGLKEKTEAVHLVVTAEEKKPYYFQMGAGYDTKRNAFGNIKAGDRNLFGLNKELSAAAEYSRIGHREDLSLKEPRFLGTRISSTLNLFNETREELNMDYGLRTYGVSLLFNRKFLKNLSTALSFSYDRRDQYQRDSASTTDSEDEQYELRDLLVITPSIIYNSTDSFISPSKGLYSSFSTDISRGIKNDFDDFYRFRLELRYFFSPLSDITFAVRGKAGYLVPDKSSVQISDDQLFFLGGTSDVRGFDENMLRYDDLNNPVGGRRFVSGTFEIRYALFSTLELLTFFDTGRIRATYENSGSNRFRSSAGLGLRYITPIGPIGFTGGLKIKPKEGEPSGKLHFSIGHTF